MRDFAVSLAEVKEGLRPGLLAAVCRAGSPADVNPVRVEVEVIGAKVSDAIRTAKKAAGDFLASTVSFKVVLNCHISTAVDVAWEVAGVGEVIRRANTTVPSHEELLRFAAVLQACGGPDGRVPNTIAMENFDKAVVQFSDKPGQLELGFAPPWARDEFRAEFTPEELRILQGDMTEEDAAKVRAAGIAEEDVQLARFYFGYATCPPTSS